MPHQILTKKRKKELKQNYLLKKGYCARLKPGEKKLEPNTNFEPSDLTKTTFKMYKRISEIYGIPIREILPSYLGNKYIGNYWIGGHAIESNKESFNHELLHSLQKILMTKENFGKTSFIETSAFPDGILKTFPKSTRAAIIAGILFDLAMTKGILSAIAITGASPFLIKVKKVGNYFKRHGPDGLILLYANPPKELNLYKIKDWEKQVIQQGYLKINGGLTKKGMSYLRDTWSRKQIIKNKN